MFRLYRNSDLDDRIFDSLQTSMAAVQAEDVGAYVLFVGDLNYYYYYYYYLESAVQGRERVRTVNQSKDPYPTQPTNGRKKRIKQYEIKKEKADHANRKALTLLLKLASPTPSNTGSLRPFQRDTERGTKVLRY